MLAELDRPKSPLQQHAEVVGHDRQVMERLGRPKTVAAKSFQPELRPQFLDPAFPIGAPVVTPLHRERLAGGWQVGHQLLEPVAGNFQQRFAASRGTLGDPLANQNQALAGPFALDLLNPDACDFGRLPALSVMTAELLDKLGEPRHEDELFPERLGCLLPLSSPKQPSPRMSPMRTGEGSRPTMVRKNSAAPLAPAALPLFPASPAHT